MKHALLLPLGALLFAPALLPAQNPLAGTWKVDLNNVDFSKKPDMYLLQNGMYSCKTCVPAYTIKADGTPQAVKLLLDQGADPLLKNQQGLTAIDFAHRAGRQDAADLISAAIRAKEPKGKW